MIFLNGARAAILGVRVKHCMKDYTLLRRSKSIRGGGKRVDYCLLDMNNALTCRVILLCLNASRIG